ncbi:MBL fold metallo-hydrolase [Pseudoalteromonas shioyasakiensis]|uniref:MBL fold metallo-hydrolase n=1 Tax=Pseudoalteromonas shioyasakiensis TaxID=1190813 RepID=UPI002118FA5B|nr:MBL fold metallo-hydrolase [Pseudoalteromonas shioyasakiensis]MCQ8876906.1 MBL fold metallo-hydrolase [Pseudoalteromonas shioyasakiensis]
MDIITLAVTPFSQNCRIVICQQTRQAFIVDPGGDADKIIAELARHTVVIKSIVLTHGHLDHVGAAKQLADHFNVQIVGPQKDEQFWFDALPMQAQMFGFVPIQPFYPDVWLEAGDTYEVGDLSFAVRHCPGHTPGHVIFYEARHQVVLVGDVIFNGSVGRTDFPKGDAQQLLHSIKTQVLTLPDETRILSGHGPDTTVGVERISNPFISGKFG